MNDIEAKEIKDVLEKVNNIIIDLKKQLEKRDEIIEENKPKVEIYNHLVDTGHCENATDLFKKIKLLKNNKEVGRNTAYSFLKKLNILRENRTPYIPFAKYFKVITTIDKRGIEHNVPLFTTHGVEFFIKKINEYGEIYNLKIEYRRSNE